MQTKLTVRGHLICVECHMLTTPIVCRGVHIVMDARDPGGRLGPYMEGGGPDLRNLRLYFLRCCQGDIITVVSDGIHDNMGEISTKN